MSFELLHLKKQNFFIKIFTHDIIDHIDINQIFLSIDRNVCSQVLSKKKFLQATRLIFS